MVKNRPNSTFQPIPIKPQKLLKSSSTDESANQSKQLKDELNQLGRLDGLISNPTSKLNKVRVPDSKKIAAILLETNIVELQRHLLTITVQNQVSHRMCQISWMINLKKFIGIRLLQWKKLTQKYFEKNFNFEVKIESVFIATARISNFNIVLFHAHFLPFSIKTFNTF